MNKEMKIGAGYIRVSTGKQEELSPDSQKRLILDHAKANGIIIPDEYIFVENGISGRKADKRPKFQQMIALAKSGKFEVILLWKFSRFARNQEESIVYKSMLRKVGVDVISISEPLVDGPFGSLIERIIEWMDEFYSIRLSGDVTRGMTEKAMRGGYQCKPPLGYTVPYHNATPQIVPEEAETVKKIFNMYVNDGRSIYQIAKSLNALGLKTSRNKNFECRSIEYILANPCYAGYIRWNRTENSTNTIKPEDEWIIREGKHEAIIPKALYDAAQERTRAEYRPRGKRPIETYKHWLSGLLKCSACGRTLISSKNYNRQGKVYWSFQCYGYSKGKCSESHSISALKIEPILISALHDVINSGTINYDIKQPQHEKNTDDTEVLKKQLERLDIKEERIKEAYINSIDSIEEYKRNKEKLEIERQQIREKLETTIITKDETTDAAMLQNIKTVYDIISSDANLEIKANAINSIIEQIIFNKKNMHIDICYYYSPSLNPLKL